MPEVDVLAQGFGVSSNEARLSLCAVTLTVVKFPRDEQGNIAVTLDETPATFKSTISRWR